MNLRYVIFSYLLFHFIGAFPRIIFSCLRSVIYFYLLWKQAAWIRVPQSIREAVELEGLSFRAGKHAAAHAFLNVVPL